MMKTFMQFCGCVVMLLVAFVLLGNISAGRRLDKVEQMWHGPSRGVVVNKIQEGAQLVTTDVKIKRVAANSEEYADKYCFVPVNASLKYGYDLSKLNNSDIEITERERSVTIILPKPGIIQKGITTLIDKNASCLTSGNIFKRGWCKLVPLDGYDLAEKLREQVLDDISKNQDLQQQLNSQIRNNAKMVFSSFLKGLGFKEVYIQEREV